MSCDVGEVTETLKNELCSSGAYLQGWTNGTEPPPEGGKIIKKKQIKNKIKTNKIKNSIWTLPLYSCLSQNINMQLLL